MALAIWVPGSRSARPGMTRRSFGPGRRSGKGSLNADGWPSSEHESHLGRRGGTVAHIDYAVSGGFRPERRNRELARRLSRVS